MRRTDHKVPHCACTLLQSPVTSSVLGQNIFLRTLFSNTPSLYVRDQVSHPYKIGTIIIRFFIFWGVPQRRFVEGYRRFGVTYQPYLQNSWRWDMCWVETSISTSLCCETSQKIEYLIDTAAEAWNNAGKIIVLCIPIFIFLGSKVEYKQIRTQW